MIDCTGQTLQLGQKVIYIGAEPDSHRILRKGRIVEIGFVSSIGKHLNACSCLACFSGKHCIIDQSYIGIQTDKGKVVKRLGEDIARQVFIYEQE